MKINFLSIYLDDSGNWAASWENLIDINDPNVNNPTATPYSASIYFNDSITREEAFKRARLALEQEILKEATRLHGEARKVRKIKNGICHCPNEKVYIIEPHCHGNGGWCGETIVKECENLKEALLFVPEYEEPCWGDNQTRISYTKNINDAKYYYDWDEQKWIEINSD